jgi:hypothetical protein
LREELPQIPWLASIGRSEPFTASLAYRFITNASEATALMPPGKRRRTELWSSAIR